MSRILGGADVAGARSVLARSWRGPLAQQSEAAQAQARAAEALLAAREQARAILEDAKAQAHAAAAEIGRQAWDQGYAEGREQALREQSALSQRLGGLVAGAAMAHGESARNLDATVLDLVLALTRAVVRREPALAPDTVLHVARAALGELSAEAVVALRVHPDDEVFMTGQLAALGLPAAVQVQVLADPAISRGGCQIESGSGRVDATLERQMERLEALIRDHFSAT